MPSFGCIPTPRLSLKARTRLKGAGQGNEAVYIVYHVLQVIDPVLGREDQIYVTGSNDGGLNFVDPVLVTDQGAEDPDEIWFYAAHAVRPNGVL